MELTNIDLLTPLPSDILDVILSFLSAKNIDDEVKLTCFSLKKGCKSVPLWRGLCFRTGKITSSSILESKQSTSNNNIEPNKLESEDSYRQHYYSHPCIPTDFSNIQAALSYTRAGCSVTLLPGMYREKIKCVNKCNIKIRAAFPRKGAALIHYQDEIIDRKDNSARNEPCISISGPTTSVHMIDIQILHSSLGSNIWGGNCSVHVDRNSILILEGCAMQSDSGRGVVVTGGSQLFLKRSIIHDCAATGLYVGDSGTVATVMESNIIRNGGGSKRWFAEDYVENASEDDVQNLHLNEVGDTADVVPPGHSGIYVENAQAVIDDTMLSGNRLTGLSVVRGGWVRMSGCDVTENGADPITIERNQRIIALNNDVDETYLSNGMIVMGPKSNNFIARCCVRSSSLDHEDTYYGKGNALFALGGQIRNTPYPCCVHRKMTEHTLSRNHISRI